MFKRSRFTLEALEPRVLLSGDGLAVGLVLPVVMAAEEVREDHPPGSAETLPAYDPAEQLGDIFEGLTGEPLAASAAAATNSALVVQSQTADSGSPSTPSASQTDSLIASVAQNVPAIAEQLTETLRVANAPPAALDGIVTISFGQKLAGSGTLSAAIVVEGTISPGNSPGHMFSLSHTWTGGAFYDWEINKVAGGVSGGHEGADPGWDFTNITGQLLINATPANPFTINIKSLTTGNVAGSLSGFDNTLDYSWRLVATTSGITGFSPELFALNTTDFTTYNTLGPSGFFAVTLGAGGRDLLLQFSPRPIVTVAPGPVWVEQGPAPIILPGGTDPLPTTLDRTFGAGAVSSIVVDPTNPLRVYVGTVNGGIWRTDNINRQIEVDANLKFNPSAPTAPNVYNPGAVYYDSNPDLVLVPDFKTTAVAGGGDTVFTEGIYQYRITYDGLKESNASDPVTINMPGGPGQVNLSGIPTNGQPRKVYRTKVGDGTYFLVATLDATTTTFSDTVSDAALVSKRPTMIASPDWQQLNTDQLPSLSITALAISPLDSAGRMLGDPQFQADTLYAGTGALSNGRPRGYAVGIYKTNNANAPLGSSVIWSIRGGQIPLNGLTITAIVPTTQVVLGTPSSINNQIVFIAAKWAGDQKVPGGVFRSADAGKKFTRIPMLTEVSAVKNLSATDLVIDPQASGTIYAAVLPGISSTGTIVKSPGGVFFSTDWGATWANTSGALYNAINDIPVGNTVVNIRLAIHQTSTSYAVYAGLVRGTEAASAISSVFRSVDGVTWTPLGNASQNGATPIHNGTQGVTNFSIVADPGNPNIVYIGGDQSNEQSPNLYKGNSLTQIWSPLTAFGNTRPHPDSRAMVFLNDTTLLEADDGGLFQLTDPLDPVNDAWISLNGDLAVTEVYSVAYDHVSNVIMAGTQDNGSIEQVGDQDGVDNDGDGGIDEEDEKRYWRQVLGGDGNTQAVAYLLSSGNSVRYSLGNSLQNSVDLPVFIRREFRLDGQQVGLTQTLQLARPSDSTMLSGLNSTDAAFPGGALIPYAIDGSDPTRFFLGLSGLYEGSLLGDKIEVLSGGELTFPKDIPTDLTKGLNRFDAIATAPNGMDGAIYASRGKYILASPDGITFNRDVIFTSDKLNEAGDPRDHIRDIVVDPADWTRAWLISRSAVFRTVNGGQKWEHIAHTGLPADLFTIEIVKRSLLIGASDGVYRANLDASLVLGKMAFARYGTGLPRVTVRDLHYDSTDEKLIAGTFGRGVWSDDIAPGTLTIEGTPGADVIKLVRNADAPYLLDILIKNPISQVFELTQSVELESVTDIFVNGGGGDDTLIIDNANGLVSVAGTFQFNGGTGTDTLSILASPSPHILSLGADKLEFRAGGGRQTIQTVQVEQVPAASNPLVSMDTTLAALRGGLAEISVWSRFLNDPEFLPNIPVVEDTLLSALARGFGSRDTSLLRALIETGENAFLIQDIGGPLLSTVAALRLALDNLDSVPGNVILSINSTTGAPVFNVTILKSLSGSAEINLTAANGKISVLGGATITADVKLHVEFGVDANGFYIVGGNADLALTLSNIAFSGELEAAGQFGFLEVKLSNATLTLDPGVGLDIFLHDPGTGAADGLIRLDELGTFDSSLVTAQLVGNPNAGADDMVFTGDFTVAAILSGQGEPFTLGTATVAFKWNDIRDITGIRVTAMTSGAQRLMDFLNVDAAEALLWLQGAGDWLGQFRDSPLFDLKIPFASGKTLGDAFDSSKAWVDKIYSQFVQLDVVGESPVPLVLDSGKITSDAKFWLQIGDDPVVSVTIAQTATNNNLSLQDLVDDFNGAFNSLPALAGRVEANISNGKLTISLVPGNAATLTLTAASATNSIVTEIGFGSQQGGTDIPLFASLQGLAAKLMSILDPDGPGVGPYDLTIGYDASKQSVKFGLKLNYSSTTTVSPSFDLPLGDLAEVSGSGTLSLTANATLAFTLGFDLRAKTAPELIPAFTPTNGRLQADAHFSLVLDGGAPIAVTVLASATTGNNNIGDLAADFNNAFQAITYQSALLDTFVQARVPVGGTKLIIGVVNDDKDGDGKVDPANEDQDGDGHLDLGEDLNNNGVLDSGEDIDGDGRLDVNEDADGDGVLDVLEGSNTKLGVINSLQIVAADNDPMVTQLGFDPHTTERSKVRGLFLDQLIDPGTGLPLPFVRGTLTLSASDLTVKAVLGKFVELSTSGGTAQGQVRISTSLKNPNALAPLDEAHRLYLKQLFKYLDQPSRILQAPTITTLQTIQLELKNISTGFGGFNAIPGGAAIVIAVPNVTSLRNSDGNFVVTKGFETEIIIPAAGTLPLSGSAVGVFITYPDLSGLFNFSCFSVPTLLHMLDALVTKLDDMQSLAPFLDKKLPLINFSISDLVKYGDQFATWVDELRKDQTGTLQKLELKIEAALHLAPDAFGIEVQGMWALPIPTNGTEAKFIFPGLNNDLSFSRTPLTSGGAIPIIGGLRIVFQGVGNSELMAMDGLGNVILNRAVAVYNAANDVLTIKLDAGAATATDVVDAVTALRSQNPALYPFTAALTTPGPQTMQVVINGVSTQVVVGGDVANDGKGAVSKMVLKIHFSPTWSFGQSKPLNFDLAALVDLLPDGPAKNLLLDLTELVQVEGSGALNVSASAGLTIDFGIDLTNPCAPVPFLYDDTTRLELKVRVLGTDLEFKIAAGAAGLFVAGGTVTLDADGNPATQDDASFVVKLLDNNGDGRHYFKSTENFFDKQNMSVTLTAGVSAVLPLFAPLATMPLGGTATDVNADGYPDNYLVVNIPDLKAVFLPNKTALETSTATTATALLSFLGDNNDILFTSGATIDVKVRFKNDNGLNNPQAPTLVWDLGTKTVTITIKNLVTTANAVVALITAEASQILPLGFAASLANPDNSTGGNNGGATVHSPVILIIPKFTDLFANIDFCALITSQTGPLLTGLDKLLEKIQQGLTSNVLGNNFPLVGKGFANAGDFIKDFREGLLAKLRDKLANAGGDPIELIVQLLQKGIYDVLGPPGLDILVQTKGSNAGVVDPPSVTSPDQVEITADCTPGAIVFNLRLKKSITALDTTKNPIALDIGVPGFGLKVEGNVVIELGFDFHLKFGITKTDGFYFDTSLPKEMEISLKATIPGLHAQGQLFFLQLDVMDDAAHPSAFDASFSVDVRGPPSHSDKLRFADFGNLDFSKAFKTNLSAVAKVNLDLVVKFAKEANFPELLADFQLIWGFDQATGLKGGTPYIAFNNIRLDLGRFLTDYLQPILQQIKKVIDPLQPVVDILSYALPGLSDLAGRPVTLLDIAEAYGYIKPGTKKFINQVAAIITLINQIPSVAPNETILIPLGSFTLAGDDPTNSDKISAGNDTNGDDIAKRINDAIANDPNHAASPTTFQTNAKAVGKSLGNMDNFKFPWLKKPLLLFPLFLGKPVTLVEYVMPTLEFKFTYAASFPVFPGVNVVTKGIFGAKIDLAFGYDTLGLQEFFSSKDKHAKDLLDGFYIKTVNDAGQVVPQLTLTGTFLVGVSVGVFGVEAGILGGIEATFGFYLHDNNLDGKVRGKEIVENARIDPRCIFEIHAHFDFLLVVVVKALGKEFEFEIVRVKLFNLDLTCPKPMVANFANDNGGAGDSFDGGTTGDVLLLNVGSRAGGRKNGNMDDGDDTVTVTQGATNDTVFVEWGGYKQEFTHVTKIVVNAGAGNDFIDLRGVKLQANIEGGDGNDTIYLSDGSGSTANGGAGDDLIIASGELTGTLVKLYGGPGNDTLTAGTTAITIYGDGGNDTITGSPEADLLYGGDGNDVIHGGPGNDYIIGNLGNDKLYGEEDDDVLVGDEGTIVSALKVTGIHGSGNDLISGGGGSDVLFGGEGDDLLFGGAFLEAGISQLTSDDLWDFIDGGSGNDVIFAEDAAGPQPGQPAGISVGDRVFFDTNGNGEFDANETGIAGVTVKIFEVLGATLLSTTTTDADGFYQFPGLSAGTAYYVEFTKHLGLHFTSPNLTGTGTGTTARTADFTLQPDQTDTSHDAGLIGPPVITISNVTVKEGNGGSVTAIFSVSLSAPATTQVTVDFEYGNSGWGDTALASFYIGTVFLGGDFLTLGQTKLNANGMPFLPRTGRLVFEPGTRVQQIAVTVNGDSVDEDNEQFRVRLTNAFKASFDDPISVGFIEGIGTIVDDDAPPTITVTDGVLVDVNFLPVQFVDANGNPLTVKTEDATNPAFLRFTVRLSNPSSRTITVDYLTADIVNSDGTRPTDSATASADYTPVTTAVTLTFSPGDVEKVFYVVVKPDAFDEFDEQFYALLSNPTTAGTTANPHPANATIADDTAVGKILDDDALPTISIDNVAVVSEGSIGITPATFTVTLSTVSGRAVTVQWTTARGTAILFPEAENQAADFKGASGTLIFAPGETSKTLTVGIYGDTLVELGGEYFFLNLLSASNAEFTDNQGVATIQDDDINPNADLGPWHVQFSNPTYTVREGDGFAEITLLRSNGSSEPFAVYFTIGGSATAGLDYTGTRGLIEFGAGETAKSFFIPILEDSLVEGDETVYLFLRAPTGDHAHGFLETAILTIQDDEPRPTITISDATTTEGDIIVCTPPNGVAMSGLFEKFTVTLTPATGTTLAPNYSLAVPYSTTPGTAQSVADFGATSGTLNFTASATSFQICVPIVDDATLERPETYFVNLGPAAATFARNQGVGVILDNETVPISGRVFLDVDGNGVFDGSDRWLMGVMLTVKDYRNDASLINVMPTTGTDSAGTFTADVRLGNVTVTVSESVVLAGMKVSTNNNSQTINVTGTFPLIPDIGFTPNLEAKPSVDALQDGGGSNPDTVYGGTGNDLIHGGDGDDWLTGGHWLGAGGAWVGVAYNATLLVQNDRFVLDSGPLLLALGSVSGRVWNDNGNGIQDGNESGLEAVKVNLFDERYVLIASTLTASAGSSNPVGSYKFDKLTPSKYYMQFVAPSDRSFSPVDVGQANLAPDIATDSDANILTGFTSAIVLGNAAARTKIDAGLTLLPPAGPGPWSVQFQFGTYNVLEDAGSAVITILRTPSSFEPVGAFFTANGTALAGLDYLSARTVVGFDGQGTLRTALVSILNDTELDGVETVFLYLRNPTGGPASGSRSMAVLLIFDNACPDDDQIFGGGGQDVMTGDFSIVSYDSTQHALVTLLGGAGKDQMFGGQGADLMYGQAGDDYLNPGSGNDTSSAAGAAGAYGGEGNDTLVVDAGLDLLDGGTGTDRVITNGDFNVVLTDTSLTHLIGTTPSSVFTLVSIEEATIIGGAGDTLINASGFTGSTLLDGGVGQNVILGGTGIDIVISNADVNFTLTGASLTRSDGGTTSWSSIDGVRLTGGPSSNVFDVSAWTGTAEMDGLGGEDLIVSSNDDSVVLLSDALLLRTLRGDIHLTSIEGATLTGLAGDNILDATNFTGPTTLDGGAGQNVLRGGTGPDRLLVNAGSNDINGGPGLDTLVSSADQNFILSDTSFTRTDGVSATLGSVELAILTGGAGNNTLDAASFHGSATLDGGLGTNVLTGGFGNDLFIVNGGQYNAVYGGGGTNVLVSYVEGATINVDFVLADGSLWRTDAGSVIMTMNSIQEARLIGDARPNQFDVSGWSGTAWLDGAGDTDSVISSNNANSMLIDALLTRSTGGLFHLVSIEAAILTGGAGNNTLDASGFSGGATLDGGAGADVLTGGSGSNHMNGGIGDDEFYVSNGLDNTISGGTGTNKLYSTGDVDFTLTDSSLLRSDGVHATLTSIQQAQLTGGRSQNQFNVSGWSGEAWLDGGVIVGGGGVADLDTVIYQKDAAVITLVGTTLAASLTVTPFAGSVGPFHLVSIEAAKLTGGAGANTLNASGFSGAVTLDGGAGTNTLNGGTGENVFIVNAGLNNVVNASSASGASNVFVSLGDVDFVLTNSSFSRSLVGNPTATVSATFIGTIQKARLIGGSSSNKFDVSGWTGQATLDGGVDAVVNIPTIDTVVSSRDANFTLTDAWLTVTNLSPSVSVGTFRLVSIEAAILTGGTGANFFNATAFTGVVVLTGGAGNDSFFGGPGNTTYLFDADTQLGSDTIVDSGGLDTLDFSQTSVAHGVNLQNIPGLVVNITNLKLNLSSGTTVENVIP